MFAIRRLSTLSAKDRFETDTLIHCSQAIKMVEAASSKQPWVSAFSQWFSGSIMWNTVAERPSFFVICLPWPCTGGDEILLTWLNDSPISNLWQNEQMEKLIRWDRASFYYYSGWTQALPKSSASRIAILVDDICRKGRRPKLETLEFLSWIRPSSRGQQEGWLGNDLVRFGRWEFMSSMLKRSRPWRWRTSPHYYVNIRASKEHEKN